MKIFLTVLLTLFLFSRTTFAASVEITDERATPDYWLTPDGDRVLLTPSQISSLNSRMLEKDSYSTNLLRYPTQMPGSEVHAMLSELSRDYSLEVPSTIRVQYALTVKRANVRLEPKPWTGDKYDSLQATALDPAEPVAVLLEADQYYFCQARNYFGWIARDELALTDRVTWQSYVAPKEFLVVIDNQKHVKVEGRDLSFQMGAIIPLIQTVSEDQVNESFRSNGNFFGGSLAIKIPAFPSVGATKNSDSEWLARLPISVNGRLKEIYVPIADDSSIRQGWLPFTTNNLIRQAFKFLGDEYGWGGLNDSVDCSAFVEDIYRSMGIELPRDANRQQQCMPSFASFDNLGTYRRYELVRRAPIGSLLFKRGHVMMKLGVDQNNTPLIIHAVSSYVANGEKIFIRKVLVSDLRYQGVAGVESIEDLISIGYGGYQP